MKRKKPPIALFSVMIVAILGLVIAGKGFAFYNLSPQEQSAQLQKEAEDKARASASQMQKEAKIDSSTEVEKMHAKLKESTGSRQPMMAKTDQLATNHSNRSSVPTVIMPDETISMPKPNTSAPTSQWYDKK